jgi:Excalibur calcium-binding domain
VGSRTEAAPGSGHPRPTGREPFGHVWRRLKPVSLRTMRSRSFLAAAVATTVALTAALTFGGSASGATPIPFGPGPKTHYTVQKQPKAGSCHYRHTKAKQPLPDTRCTPGARNPKVTQKTIASTICKSGYTTKIRPPASITDKEKAANAKSYAYKATLHQAEYDHLIPLELGGDPNDRRNLWVEPPSPGHRTSQGVSNPKDKVENEAKSLVCHHKVTLVAMQRAIATNWTTAISAVKHIAPTPTPKPSATHSSSSPVVVYANCTALHAVYPHGVGLPGAHDHTASGTNPVTDFTVNAAEYDANKKSDRDGDGIACEKH